MIRNRTKVILVVGIIIMLVSVFAAIAATNSVSGTFAGESSHLMTAEQLKPAVCTMTLVNIVVPSAGGNATQANDLILGTSGNDTGANQLNGLGGDDCIVGGAGDDFLNGGKGNDILLGGSGDDDLNGGQNDDYMDGGEGTNDVCNTKHGVDTTDNCETIEN
jgi:Ca2+-binding RTX toxin-like protein